MLATLPKPRKAKPEGVDRCASVEEKKQDDAAAVVDDAVEIVDRNVGPGLDDADAHVALDYEPGSDDEGAAAESDVHASVQAVDLVQMIVH